MSNGYAPGEDPPLRSYLVLTGAFGGLMAGALGAAHAAGREVDRPGAVDVILAGLATQKLSRQITKDKVTSFIRAPFTRFERRAGYGEVSEQPRGEGIRHVVGELLVCPYCIGQWVAGGFGVGWIFAPRTTRFLAATWAVQAVADAAQLAYSTAEKRSSSSRA